MENRTIMPLQIGIYNNKMQEEQISYNQGSKEKIIVPSFEGTTKRQILSPLSVCIPPDLSSLQEDNRDQSHFLNNHVSKPFSDDRSYPSSPESPLRPLRRFEEYIRSQNSNVTMPQNYEGASTKNISGQSSHQQNSQGTRPSKEYDLLMKQMLIQQINEVAQDIRVINKLQGNKKQVQHRSLEEDITKFGLEGPTFSQKYKQGINEDLSFLQSKPKDKSSDKVTNFSQLDRWILQEDQKHDSQSSIQKKSQIICQGKNFETQSQIVDFRDFRRNRLVQNFKQNTETFNQIMERREQGTNSKSDPDDTDTKRLEEQNQVFMGVNEGDSLMSQPQRGQKLPSDVIIAITNESKKNLLTQQDEFRNDETYDSSPKCSIGLYLNIDNHRKSSVTNKPRKKPLPQERKGKFMAKRMDYQSKPKQKYNAPNLLSEPDQRFPAPHTQSQLTYQGNFKDLSASVMSIGSSTQMRSSTQEKSKQFIADSFVKQIKGNPQYFSQTQAISAQIDSENVSNARKSFILATRKNRRNFFTSSQFEPSRPTSQQEKFQIVADYKQLGNEAILNIKTSNDFTHQRPQDYQERPKTQMNINRRKSRIFHQMDTSSSFAFKKNSQNKVNMNKMRSSVIEKQQIQSNIFFRDFNDSSLNQSHIQKKNRLERLQLIQQAIESQETDRVEPKNTENQGTQESFENQFQIKKIIKKRERSRQSPKQNKKLVYTSLSPTQSKENFMLPLPKIDEPENQGLTPKNILNIPIEVDEYWSRKSLLHPKADSPTLRPPTVLRSPQIYDESFQDSKNVTNTASNLEKSRERRLSKISVLVNRPKIQKQSVPKRRDENNFKRFAKNESTQEAAVIPKSNTYFDKNLKNILKPPKGIREMSKSQVLAPTIQFISNKQSHLISQCPKIDKNINEWTTHIKALQALQVQSKKNRQLSKLQKKKLHQDIQKQINQLNQYRRILKKFKRQSIKFKEQIKLRSKKISRDKQSDTFSSKEVYLKLLNKERATEIRSKLEEFISHQMLQSDSLENLQKENLDGRIVNDSFHDIILNKGMVEVSKDYDPGVLEKLLKEAKVMRLKALRQRRASLKQRFMDGIKLAAKIMTEKGASYFDKRQRKKNAMMDRMRKYRIKEMGLDIKKMKYDLEKNVIVDSLNLHQGLQVFDLRNETNPSHMAKQSNRINLIQGYPQYFVIDLDLSKMLEEKSLVFPVNFKVFSQQMVDAAYERYEKNKRFKKKHQMKKSNPLLVNSKDDQELTALLKQVNIFISTKTRLPSQENNEKHIQGIQNLNFAFNPGNWIELATKKRISLNQKIYLSFKFGDLEEENNMNKADDQEIDFFFQSTFSLKQTYLQIQADKKEIQSQSFLRNPAFDQLVREFKGKSLNQLTQGDKKQYLIMQQGIIEKELERFYVQFYKELEKDGEEEDTQEEKLNQKHITLHMMNMEHDCGKASAAVMSKKTEEDKVDKKASKETHVVNETAQIDDPFQLKGNREFLDKNKTNLPINATLTLQQKNSYKQIFGKELELHKLAREICQIQKKRVEELQNRLHLNHYEQVRQENQSHIKLQVSDINETNPPSIDHPKQIKNINFYHSTRVSQNRSPALTNDSYNVDKTSSQGIQFAIFNNNERVSTQKGDATQELMVSEEGNSDDYEPKLFQNQKYNYNLYERNLIQWQLKKIRAYNNITRKLKVYQAVQNARDDPKYIDVNTQVKDREFNLRSEQRNKWLEDFKYWDKYRQKRWELQEDLIQNIKHSAVLRHLVAHVVLRIRLQFLKETIHKIRRERAKQLKYLMFAIKAKIHYKYIVCKRNGETLQIRLQKFIQRHFKFYGGIPAFQEKRRDQASKIFKQFFDVVIYKIKKDDMFQKLHDEGRKLYYITSTVQGSIRNQKERITLLRHMFFRNFRLIYGIYRKKFKEVKADRSDQVNQKIIDKYYQIFMMFKKFNQAYTSEESKYLQKDLADLKSEEDDDEDDLMEDSDEAQLLEEESIRSKASDPKKLSKEDRKKQKEMALITRVFRLKEIKKQKQMENYQLALSIVMDRITTIVKHKVLQYTMGYNMFRYCYYDLIIRQDLQEKYQHLGNPMHRQYEIRQQFKIFKEMLLENQKNCFKGTDQILKDGTTDEKHQPQDQRDLYKIGEIKKRKKLMKSNSKVDPNMPRFMTKKKTANVFDKSVSRLEENARLVEMMDQVISHQYVPQDSMVINENSGYKMFLFSVNREEIHRIVWKCAQVYTTQKYGENFANQKKAKPKKKKTMKKEKTGSQKAMSGDEQEGDQQIQEKDEEQEEDYGKEHD